MNLFLRFTRQFFFVLLVCSSIIYAQQKTIITGSVLNNSNEPLAYVNVFVINSYDGAMTDENGNFEFTTELKDSIEIIASIVGYKKYNETFDITKIKGKPIKIILTSETLQTSEVIVTASSFSSDKEKGVIVTSMDVMTTPGGAADIFQSLKTLPGLTQVSESAELYVRGGDPYETLTLFDQASLNHPYTFESAYGGLFSNINTSSIDDIYFSSGGFSSKYGNALSGVLALESKDKPDVKNINLSFSLASAEINAGIPINNKLGFRFIGRQSFTGPIFWLNGGKDDFTVVPVSRDFNSSLSYKYSHTGIIKIFGYAANDKEGVNVKLPGYTDQFTVNSNSNFINLQLKDIFFDNVVIKSSLSRSYYNNDWNLGILDITREDIGLKSRTDLEYVVDNNLKFSTGFEVESRNAQFIGTIPKDDYDMRDDAEGEVINSSFDVTRFGGYFEIEKSDLLGIDNLFAVAGIRTDLIQQLSLNWFDPRLNIGYKLNSNSSLSFGWGIFHQHPDPRLYSQTDGNPDLKSMRADHFIISYDYKFSDTDNFRIEAYYKDYSNLPLEDVAINYNNKGYGYAKGIDILFKGNVTRKLSGWISYGIIDTKRKWMDFENFTSSDFDITHNFTFIAKYDISPEFQIGINYKYATGKPFTPVVSSVYREDMNVYEPIYGADNSNRYPDYNRLDIRFTYLTRLFEKWFTVFFVEGMNILDIKNIVDYSYNKDYSDKRQVQSYFGQRTIVFGAIVDL